MAYDYRDVLMTNSTDANFRTWVTAIHDMIIACGLVQTSDTGQINRTTVLAPTTSATFMGYEIYRFNDSLQGTKPIYLKVEFGGGSPAASPNVRFTVGPSTNGAGTLGSAWGSAITTGGTSSQVLPQACFASGDGTNDLSGIVLSMWAGYVTAATTSFQFFLERSRDANGVATGDGLAFGLGGDVRVIAYTGTWSTTNCAEIRMLCPMPTPESTGTTVAKGITDTTGDNLYWMPCIFSCPGVPPWRSKMLVGVHPYDAGMGTTFVVPVYGSSVIDGADFTFLQPGAAMPSTGLGAYNVNSTSNYFLSQLWTNPPP